ncbi:hypothetical protein CY0110_17632 [Crocosphaera chwakensis CCY0110]|uniref:Uncharacterized protein n=1 Tax=Crocosphaera chwakensis CCY0110 TaxID=391612 RepID=A3IIK8_9CHRO|nr:hypothetical protein CY0110_17632 [Crocosphaera chwakensis CCY0110]
MLYGWFKIFLILADQLALLFKNKKNQRER